MSHPYAHYLLLSSGEDSGEDVIQRWKDNYKKVFLEGPKNLPNVKSEKNQEDPKRWMVHYPPHERRKVMDQYLLVAGQNWIAELKKILNGENEGDKITNPFLQKILDLDSFKKRVQSIDDIYNLIREIDDMDFINLECKCLNEYDIKMSQENQLEERGFDYILSVTAMCPKKMASFKHIFLIKIVKCVTRLLYCLDYTTTEYLAILFNYLAAKIGYSLNIGVSTYLQVRYCGIVLTCFLRNWYPYKIHQYLTTQTNYRQKSFLT